MIGRLRRRWLYKQAWEDYRKGYLDAVGGLGRDPTKRGDPMGSLGWVDAVWRIAYDAGHAHGTVASRREPPLELPVEVWSLVLAERLRP